MSKLLMQSSRSCGSVIGPHSLRIRAIRKAGFVSTRRSYFWDSITLRCGFQFTSAGSNRGGGATSTVSPAVCALTAGMVARQAAAKARLVAVLIMITVHLLIQAGKRHLRTRFNEFSES